uniref:Uncharacterized protein n=1 Tax=Anguilla anguilla TaxID=7936 RepID=A0A0E9T7K8_ANGAN
MHSASAHWLVGRLTCNCRLCWQRYMKGSVG